MDVPYCSKPNWVYEPGANCGCSDLQISTSTRTYGVCAAEDLTTRRVFCYVNADNRNPACCQDKTSTGYCINYDLCESTTVEFSNYD